MSPFFIDENHPDFPATGLNHSTFVHDDHFEVLTPQELSSGKFKGLLKDDLLQEFRRVTGL